MKNTTFENFSRLLVDLLTRVYQYCDKHVKCGIQYGLCVVTPKRSDIPLPTAEVQQELERRASAYFKKEQNNDKLLRGYYFQHVTLPLYPHTSEPLERVFKKKFVYIFHIFLMLPNGQESYKHDWLSKKYEITKDWTR